MKADARSPATHPRQSFEQQLGETQGGSSDLRGPIVNHVVVDEGQLHQILGQSVSLYIRLRQKRRTINSLYKSACKNGT